LCIVIIIPIDANNKKNMLLGKSTLHPSKIVITNTAFLHLVFLWKYRHHILDYFCLFEVYLWRNNTCHGVWNCIHILELGLWVEFFGEVFCGHYYWYTSNESKAIWKLKNFGWKFIKNMFFFHFFNNKGNFFYVSEKKTNTKWKRKRLYSWVL
jgi:hypothetical protein